MMDCRRQGARVFRKPILFVSLYSLISLLLFVLPYKTSWFPGERGAHTSLFLSQGIKNRLATLAKQAG